MKVIKVFHKSFRRVLSPRGGSGSFASSFSLALKDTWSVFMESFFRLDGGVFVMVVGLEFGFISINPESNFSHWCLDPFSTTHVLD